MVGDLSAPFLLFLLLLVSNELGRFDQQQSCVISLLPLLYFILQIIMPAARAAMPTGTSHFMRSPLLPPLGLAAPGPPFLSPFLSPLSPPAYTVCLPGEREGVREREGGSNRTGMDDRRKEV